MKAFVWEQPDLEDEPEEARLSGMEEMVKNG